MATKKARLNRNDEIYFLRDFDLLTAIPPEEKPLFSPADMQVGEAMMSSTYVLKQDNTKYPLGCHIDEFKQFGPGIYLLFKFLKYLTIVFGVVSVLAIISVIVLVSGPVPRSSNISNEIKSGLLKTTIYNLTRDDFASFVGLSFGITVLLAVFLVYWSEKERVYIIECLKAAPLASYSTVILKTLPESYNEQSLCEFLEEKFGEVAEVYTVRNFGDDILYYKELNQIVQEYKKEKVMTELQPERSSHQLANLFFQFRNGHLKIKEKIKESGNYRSGFAFVQFRRIEDREKLLQLYSRLHLMFCPSLKCCSRKPLSLDPPEAQTPYRLEQMQFVECEMEPGGILWQNLHLTRAAELLKTSAMLFLVMVVLSLSIFLIFLLSAVQMSVMNCKYKDLAREQILALGDRYALLSYCINLSFSQFYTQSDICSVYNSEYIKLTIMIFMIPLSISLFKLVLTELMKGLVSFRRYAYEIKKIESQSTIIFVFYFLVTGVLQLVIYLGSDSTSIFELFTPMIQTIVSKDFKPSKITLFSDYSPNWYITASYNVIIIGAISFNLSGLGIILYCRLRKRIFAYFARKQQIQGQMNTWLRGYVLEIEYVYAALLTIVYFTLLFGSTMPLLYVLAFLSFFILFWSYKFIFVRFCARPLTYSHSINRRVRKMILGALIMQCFFTPIFYAAPGIAEFEGETGLFHRILALWHYLVLMILLVLYLLLERPARILFSVLKEYLKNRRRHESKKKTTTEDEPLPSHFQRKSYTLPTIVRKKHNELALESYSMHENLKYKDVLRTLYTINNKERTRKTCVLNRELLLLYEDNVKSSCNETEEGSYRTLVEVIKLVRRDFKKYAMKNKKGRNPYLNTKRKLYEIFEHAKKGSGHKYTLCLTNSNGFRERIASVTGDNIIEQDNVDKEGVFQEELGSSWNATGTKDMFLGSNFSNLEQVIEASMEEEEEVKSRHSKQKQKGKKEADKLPKDTQQPTDLPLPLKVKRVRLQVPQNSGQTLNNSNL